MYVPPEVLGVLLGGPEPEAVHDWGAGLPLRLLLLRQVEVKLAAPRVVRELGRHLTICTQHHQQSLWQCFATIWQLIDYKLINIMYMQAALNDK